MRLLLVEDSARLAAALGAALRASGFVVDDAADGRLALRQLEICEYDLMVLDLMLPKVDGMAVLKALRASAAATRVLVLSARDETVDRVAALDAGADDYLVKPFELEELTARLAALGRRRFGETHTELRHGGLVLDTRARLARVDGAALTLTPKEYALLETLLRHRGESLTRAALFGRLYDGLSEASDRVIEVIVSTLRTKLATAGIDDLIETRRGFGYRVP